MTSTLTTTDPIMDLGRKVLGMLAEGYDGEQIAGLGCTVEQAEQALHAYAARVLHGTAPKAMPSTECGAANAFDGWCYTHGVFHPDHLCAAFQVEVRMSDCPLACKVHRCEKCGAEQVVHVAAYGVGHADVEPTSIDPTLRGSCATHGPDVAVAYLGNERYGCWHCNPTRPAPRPLPPVAPPPPAEPVGEIPAWMLGEEA